MINLAYNIAYRGKKWENIMKPTDIYILRDLENAQSVSDAIKEKGLNFEYRILNLEVIESNRFISRMLKVPLASRVLHLRKLRVVEGVPKSIDRTYILYEKVKGIEDADFAHESFYKIIRDRFGYMTHKSEEEILIVEASEEEQRLLDCRDKELMMIRGTTYKEEPELFEYFEIVSVSDFYRFRSVSK